MYQESYAILRNPRHDFLKVTIQDKAYLLGQKQTLPYEYWIKEKDLLIQMVRDHIKAFKARIKDRMQEIEAKTNIFIDHPEIVQCQELQYFKMQWTYKMSFLTHDFDELNDWRILLNTIRSTEYKGVQDENEI